MPLTRLYRLGASPQRITKGYLLGGDPAAVGEVRARLSGRELAHGITAQTPPAHTRAVELATGWRWLHDREARVQTAAALTEAVARLVDTASRWGCVVLPCATRPAGERSWQTWTVADQHVIAMLDDIEREVAHNLFRKHVPVLVALTGRPGLGASVEPLGSRRLADSEEHLASRFLASASPRHVALVTAELRRTTGIKDLRTMDVHPLGEAGPDGVASLVVRCVDGQAFVGTTLAHAVLVQALAMAARRLVRDGRRHGNTDARLLDRRRTGAVLHGIGGRVPAEPSQHEQHAGKQQDAGQIGLDLLALRLLDELTPELGTLEVEFEEFAPICAWLTAFADARVARTETEYLVRRVGDSGSGLAAVIGDLIAAPAEHTPARMLAYSGRTGHELELAARRWTRRLSDPPPLPRGSRRTRPVTAQKPPVGKQKPPVNKPKEQDTRPGAAGPAKGDLALLEGLASHAEADAATRLALLRDVVSKPRPAGSELVPSLGSRHQDTVRQARRALRPPGPQQVSCPLAELRWGSSPVSRAARLAGREGSALLRTTVSAADRDKALAVALELFGARPAQYSAALLAVARFKDAKGEQVTFEVVLLDEKAAP